MSMGSGPWAVMHSFRQDSNVKAQKLKPGTGRRILRFARPYRAYISWFLVLVVIDAVLVVATPLIFAVIIDDGVGKGNSALVTRLAILVAVIAVLSAGIGLVQRYFSSRIGEGLIYDLRSEVFAHVQRMPVAFFTRTQTGALISRLNNDVIGAQQAFTSTLSGVVSNSITLVLVTIAMLALSWQITVAALVMLPLFLWPAKYVGRQIQGLTRQAMQVNAEMSTMMTERFNVSGALLAKLFGRPEEEDQAFTEKAGRVRDMGVKIAMSNRVFFTALTLVASLATALVYGVGGNLAIDGALTVGTLVALAGLLGRLYGPLTALSNVRVDVMTALVSFERVFEVLDLPPMIDEKPDAVTVSRGPTTIEFDHVAFRYPTADEVSLASLESVAVLDSAPTQQVLHDVSFTVEPGQLVALVGPSGAGKTTITSLVARLYDVTGGAVRLDGHDVRDITLASLHDVIGVVTQDAHMFHETIRSNLLYAAPDATDEALRAACRGRPDLGPGDLPARWSRHRGRRPWLPAVRWREAAAGHRPAPAEGAVGRDPRRGDRPPRLGVRGGGAGGPGARPRGPYVAGHRSPAVHGARRRRHPRRRGRDGRRAWPPRGAVGRRGHLRRPLPHAVRQPGARTGRLTGTVRRLAVRGRGPPRRRRPPSCR